MSDLFLPLEIVMCLIKLLPLEIFISLIVFFTS